MIADLPPSIRRLLAVGLLLLPIVLSALFVAVPLHLAERNAAALADIEALIERLEQRLVTREQVMAEVRRLERVSRLDPQLLAAETPGVAGAALAGKLAQHLEAAGGWLDSTQVLDPVIDPPVMRISVRLRGVIDMVGLRAFLHQIERAEPILTIERLTLRNDDFGERSGRLVTEVTVVGYARSGQGAARDGSMPDGSGSDGSGRSRSGQNLGEWRSMTAAG